MMRQAVNAFDCLHEVGSFERTPARPAGEKNRRDRAEATVPCMSLKFTTIFFAC